MNTWIVYRVVNDKRCSGGTRWVPIGWVNHVTESLARSEAKKWFNRFDEEELKLIVTEPGCGWLM
jgi:hypothetical protein